MQIQIGSALVHKYASSESGDTLEIIERPHGGLSMVLVDGQRSGRAAKAISNIVARKAISLLGEGIRDGAAARAAHDYLRTHRRGQVSAELQIISVDLQTRTLVISRNTQCPALVCAQGQTEMLDAPSQAIGIHVNTKPVIVELPLLAGLYAVVYTDGLRMAAEGAGSGFDIAPIVQQGAAMGISAQALADLLLQRALEVEHHRPRDDISILVCAVLPIEVPDGARRLSASFPLGTLDCAGLLSYPVGCETAD